MSERDCVRCPQCGEAYEASEESEHTYVPCSCGHNFAAYKEDGEYTIGWFARFAITVGKREATK